jgi:RND family efflux transporter MFP subunit
VLHEYGTLIRMSGKLDTSALLRELRIERDVRRPRWRGRLLLLGVVLLAALGGVLWYVTAQRGRPTVRVAVARAATEPGTAPSVLDASGYVTARRQATVSAKITGKVTEVLIEEGMRVERGAVLARLDDTDAQAQLALSRAELIAARSAVGEIRALLEQAEREFVRQKQLFDRQLVAAQALDSAVAQRDTLRARLLNAEERIKVAQQSVAVAEVAVDSTIVRAPFSGVVVAKSAQPGEMISPISAGGGFTRTGIGTIVDMDSLEIQVDVNEAFINRVRPGQPAEATLNAYPDWKIPGAVIAIIPTADRSKATVKVRIAIKQKDRRIVPDMGVRVAFLSGKPAARAAPSTAVLVPATALVPAAATGSAHGQSAVFVYTDDRVQRRAVTLGVEIGGQRQVLSGLRAGERVVVSPPSSLEDGQAVRLAESG